MDGESALPDLIRMTVGLVAVACAFVATFDLILSLWHLRRESAGYLSAPGYARKTTTILLKCAGLWLGPPVILEITLKAIFLTPVTRADFSLGYVSPYTSLFLALFALAMFAMSVLQIRKVKRSALLKARSGSCVSSVNRNIKRQIFNGCLPALVVLAIISYWCEEKNELQMMAEKAPAGCHVWSQASIMEMAVQDLDLKIRFITNDYPR